MSRMSRDVVQRRPDEIVEACRQLYETHTFHEITLKDISERTSLSRPSIYNYFSTKEEIFLALLKKEYAMWADDLEAILRAPSMDASYFSQVMAAALDRRQMMLRIQCMDLYEIEEHSGMEAPPRMTAILSSRRRLSHRICSARPVFRLVTVM